MASACGPTDVLLDQEPGSTDAVTQRVLFAPPAPASGNIDDHMTAPDSCEYYHTYVLLFPESHKVAVFDYTYGRDC